MLFAETTVLACDVNELFVVERDAISRVKVRC